MPVSSNGIVTARDSLTIDAERQALWNRLTAFLAGEPEAVRTQFRLGKDVRDWKVEWAQADLCPISEDHLQRISYRPFETHWTYYTGHSRGIHCYPRNEVMRNYLEGPNLGLLVSKAHKDAVFAHVFVTRAISEAIFLSGTTASNAMNLPLYLYPDQATQQRDAFAPKHRVLNLDPKLYAAICKAAGIDPADQAGPDDDFRAAAGEARPSEVKVFDYVYGVLHSPAYRETFAEFLKIDFPRIPCPPSPQVFRHVSEKGEQLRRLHLMEPAAVGETPYPYVGEGDDVVASGFPTFEADTEQGGPSTRSGRTGRVHINADQYFAGVPEIAWTFPVGGYQPAQKWLKDRRGRALSWGDIGHYQKVVKVLVETDRIMRTIELPLATQDLGQDDPAQCPDSP
ncbi:MAG TPA: type ISP restriction/modification enzyme [Sphingomonas sp.]|nr:type ISP restriction/modification enzyme [Sphingomonas sp.]